MEITKTFIAEQLADIVNSRLGVVIKRDDYGVNISDLGSMDSLDHLELILDIEDRYDINIPDDEFDNLLCIHDFTDFVVEHILKNGDELGIDSDCK